MLILLISAALVLTSYLIYVRFKIGYTPKSISESFYLIKADTNSTWQFISTLAYSATTIVIVSYSLWDGISFTPLMALGGLGIFGVTVFAGFYSSAVQIFHYIFAGLGFTLASISFWVSYDMWWWTVSIAVVSGAVMYLTRRSHPIWWLEITLSSMIIIGLALIL